MEGRGPKSALPKTDSQWYISPFPDLPSSHSLEYSTTYHNPNRSRPFVPLKSPHANRKHHSASAVHGPHPMQARNFWDPFRLLRLACTASKYNPDTRLAVEEEIKNFLDWRWVKTLKARSLPIIPRVLLAISYISPSFAGLIICTRRDVFLPNCQTCTRGPYTERQMRWNLSNEDITKPVCRVSQCVPKVKASS